MVNWQSSETKIQKKVLGIDNWGETVGKKISFQNGFQSPPISSPLSIITALITNNNALEWKSIPSPGCSTGPGAALPHNGSKMGRDLQWWMEKGWEE